MLLVAILLEKRHFSYAEDSPDGDGTPTHETTVHLCRWCHARVHDSWARIDDDASPDPEAIAEREPRRADDQSGLGVELAAKRFDCEGRITTESKA